MEALLHRRIFKKNIILGYMHSSFALGWFLLIVFGALEVSINGGPKSNHFYEPIFYKFFHRSIPVTKVETFFAFIMDFLLLYILSGLLLAIIKRFYSRLFGLKKTTKLYWTDKIALYSLWLIFPLRLMAESATASQFHNGGFLTNSFGNVLSFLHIDIMMYPLWWLYSIDLFIFFTFLPFSRYMHIPTEIILIALRRSGIKTTEKLTAFSEIEINSCSSCGICIDSCQLQDTLKRQNMVPAYLFQKIRHSKVTKKDLYDCLNCGRCEEVCPVNISITNIKLAKRNERLNVTQQNYDYLPHLNIHTATIAYFAGCMTHLTPSIIKSMINIFKKLNINFVFLDENGSICCGRPLELAGKTEDAKKLFNTNKSIIKQSNAKVLVTSCPICYKVFKEKYKLDIPVLHHSQLFDKWIKNGMLQLKQSNLKATYHDPCDLGRGSKIYDEPRNVLSHCLTLIENEYSRDNSLCCGGSLGNFYLNENDRIILSKNAYKKIMHHSTDILITSCPLCKKTFQKVASKPVLDISEIVNRQLTVKTDLNHENVSSLPLIPA